MNKTSIVLGVCGFLLALTPAKEEPPIVRYVVMEWEIQYGRTLCGKRGGVLAYHIAGVAENLVECQSGKILGMNLGKSLRTAKRAGSAL